MILREETSVSRIFLPSGAIHHSILFHDGGNSSWNATNDVQDDDEVINRLLPTLVRCFGIILCGYLAGEFRWITGVETKGLNVFTTQFALPALIVLNLAAIDFSSVNWLFILAVLVGKGVASLVTITATVAGRHPVDLSQAAMYAIFCTQGNDFGLAYPTVSALYAVHRPLYPQYVYLLAPLSLNILNPLGVLSMELSKMSRNRQFRPCTRLQTARIMLSVMRGMLYNLCLPATVLGVAGNFLFAGEVPLMLREILQSFASAFKVAVLFLLGLRLAEAGPSFSRSKAFTGVALLATKMFATPLLIYGAVMLLCSGEEDMEDLANCGFFYSLAPTEPIVLLFATQYGMSTKTMASTMFLCTILFPPMTFLTAKAIISNSGEILVMTDCLRTVTVCASIFGLLASLWMTVAFVRNSRWKRGLYSIVFSLIVSQMVMSLGTLLRSGTDFLETWMVYISLALLDWGVLATAVFTALLAVALFLAHKHPQITGTRLLVPSLVVGLGLPTVITVATLLFIDNPVVNYNIDFTWKIEDLVAAVVRGLSLTTTVVCLVLHKRALSTDVCCCRDQDCQLVSGCPAMVDDPLDSSFSQAPSLEPQLPAMIDVKLEEHEMPGGGPTKCKGRVDGLPPPVMFRISGVLLDPPAEKDTLSTTRKLRPLSSNAMHRTAMSLLFLAIVLSSGFIFSLGMLLPWRSSGLFTAVKFLYALLMYGQGVFVFAIFWVKRTVSWRHWVRRMSRSDGSKQPEAESMDDQTRSMCYQFLTNHYDSFLKQLSKKRKLQNGKPVFRGQEFVDWLVEEGVVRERHDAVLYGRNLMVGRVLHKLGQNKDFDDCSEKYTLSSMNWVP